MPKVRLRRGAWAIFSSWKINFCQKTWYTFLLENFNQSELIWKLCWLQASSGTMWVYVRNGTDCQITRTWKRTLQLVVCIYSLAILNHISISTWAVFALIYSIYCFKDFFGYLSFHELQTNIISKRHAHVPLMNTWGSACTTGSRTRWKHWIVWKFFMTL